MNMKPYLDFLTRLIECGASKSDRTGMGVLSVFGYPKCFNLQEKFPLVTTEKRHLNSIIHELLWFLKGETNIRYLKENGVTIWNEWASLWQTVTPPINFRVLATSRRVS